MRKALFVTALALATAAPLFAQEGGVSQANGYVTGVGGFASAVGNTTGDVQLEGGVRVAPHVMVYGNVGRFSNLQGDLQPSLANTTTALAANQGLNVVGGGSLPASYVSGGVRVELPVDTRFLPYVLGGLGVAHLTPNATFAYSSGAMPDGSTPATGADVTSALTTAGAVTTPSSSNALMLTLGGGVQIPVANRWTADIGYRFSRIAADTTLSATPLNTNGMTFGFGYRF